MRTRSKLAVVLAGALLTAASPSFTQTTEIDPFTAIKPGQWVKIKGVLQQDSALVATEVRIITTAMKDDDCEIAAPLRRIVDPAQKQLEVFGMQVKMKGDATYESHDKSLTGFDGLKPGMQVEIEGTYANRAFQGREVQLEKTSAAQELAKLVGKAEKIDAEMKTITVMGIPCQISGNTKVKSAEK
jgi:hypothetical protein